jgi:RND family efflux transporter MFP subunit
MKLHATATIPTTSSTKRWRVSLISLLIAGAVGGTWFFYGKSTSAQVDAKAKVEEKAPIVYELAAVDIGKTEQRELQIQLSVSGSLMPLNQATVRAKVAAEVQEVLIQEGMPVKKGQVIARFDGADLRARLTAQDATLDEARAKLDLAQKNRHSNEALLKQNYISQTAFDNVDNSVDLAKASLKSAQAQREIAQLALADTVVRAPVDGIISKRNVQPGEKVSPDSPLVTIVDLNQLTLEASVPASEIPRVKIGQEVRFHVDGFGERTFTGNVARINPAAEVGSRSMTVYVAVNNRDLALKGGMFAKGQLTLEKHPEMPTIPVTALRKHEGRDVVYRIVNNQIQIQPVKLGLRNEEEGLVQVLEGLEVGSTVVNSKLEGVKAGSKVKLPVASPTPVAESNENTVKG